MVYLQIQQDDDYRFVFLNPKYLDDDDAPAAHPAAPPPAPAAPDIRIPPRASMRVRAHHRRPHLTRWHQCLEGADG